LLFLFFGRLDSCLTKEKRQRAEKPIISIRPKNNMHLICSCGEIVLEDNEINPCEHLTEEELQKIAKHLKEIWNIKEIK
jgi:hypothetical protein